MFYSIFARPLEFILRSLIVTLLFIGSTFAAEPVTADPVTFDIEKQPLANALNEFARQSDRELLFSTDIVLNKDAPLVAGTYEPEEALDMLLADTGLRYSTTGNETFLVNVADEDAGPGKSQPASSPVLMAQNQTSAQQTRTSINSETTNEKAEDEIPLEEIIVTGSRIRGVKNDSSPIFTYSREDIDASGLSTLSQFVRSLSLNFGSHSENEGGPRNRGRGATVNLRGLGVGATLTLLNGHRIVAPGGEAIADISMIPLVAIERVEILADGASAVYGSDAVAGVANFILRKDFEGAESRLRYGLATQGGGEEFQFSQALGKSWSSGNVLLSYKHSERDHVDSQDRSYTDGALDPTFLSPSQNGDSVFLTAKQEISNRVEFFGDAFYSRRKSEMFQSFQAHLFGVERIINTVAETEMMAATSGARIDLGETWQAEIVGAYNRTEIDSHSLITVHSDGSPISEIDFNSVSNVRAVDAKADGSLFHLPGGAVKVAIGGDFHREQYSGGFIPSTTDQERDVFGVFGQAYIPLVGAENRRLGVERLELNFSTRYEDYSDFGNTTNWKAGLLWSPVNGFNLRGTYGTSFRAPRFSQLSEIQNQTFLYDAPDTESPTGFSLTMLAAGGNPALQPETSTLLTVGFDIQPPSITELKVGFTYFDIDFRDKVRNPSPISFFPNDPVIQFVVDRMPAPDLMIHLMSLPGALDFSGGADPADTDVFIDGRLRNMAAVVTNGIDLTASYGLDSTLGQWNFAVSGTYLIEQELVPATGATTINDLNRVGRPADLKLRGAVAWTYGNGFSVNTFVSYVDGYRDTRDLTAIGLGVLDEPVDSWTTVALNIGYDTEDLRGLFGNTVFSLNIQNLFDSDPPFVGDVVNRNDINYDPRNASPMGRYMSFNITKKW